MKGDEGKKSREELAEELARTRRRLAAALEGSEGARERAEEASRESEERLRFALDAARMGSWELDLVTGTARRSLGHDQIFGYEKPLPKWGYDLFLEHVHPEDRSFVQRRFDDAARTGGTGSSSAASSGPTAPSAGSGPGEALTGTRVAGRSASSEG